MIEMSEYQIASQETIDFFLKNYKGFSEECKELMQRNKDYAFKTCYSLDKAYRDAFGIALFGYNKDGSISESVYCFERGY